MCIQKSTLWSEKKKNNKEKNNREKKKKKRKELREKWVKEKEGYNEKDRQREMDNNIY